jgi:HEAT repeats
VRCEDPVETNLTRMTDRFQQAMRLMRKHDPQIREDGFALLRLHAAEHVDQLIAEFAREQADHGLRCWLLELIGEARSPKALPALTEQLHSGDESLRWWAVRGLEQLGTKPARYELWQARANGLID